eukprot:CAMPEP_0201554490 /NCGR_PEP_ID=MMETSP0173_2-20130828/41593_1 /ASSEMBLY_ACC=CAM_ASM_000268 /TAXON_ID=218659 /ORGANISM="Vexillifera sp., Strain DIVA3 564/2" /LENGTH=56 /DNA_ID=CAMNT_0047965793 /DNA_START=14 /DNA_END=181 /DNA_ORIENTATION=+
MSSSSLQDCVAIFQQLISQMSLEFLGVENHLNKFVRHHQLDETFQDDNDTLQNDDD